MTDLKTKYALICDHGLFGTNMARRLAIEYGKVGFHPLAWNRGFPTNQEIRVGEGFDEFTHVPDLFKELMLPEGKRPDILIWPDIMDGSLQIFLRQQGFRVFGSGWGDQLELYRYYAKQIMKAVGLPVGPYKLVTGMNALREELKKNEGERHVKISLLRGLTETFKALDYWLMEARLNRMEHELGRDSETTDFIIEDAIPTTIEMGYDGINIDGNFPAIAAMGVEIKDVAYGCVMQRYRDLPSGMRLVNERLAPVLKRYDYRNKFSTEIRSAKDGTPYAVDFTARQASPAGECVDQLWTNIGAMMWEGAEGRIIQPIPAAKYAIQSIIYSDFADENWQGVKFPEKYRDNVKLYYHTRDKDGHDFVIPQTARMNEIGSIVTIANTLEEAIKENEKIAETVEGDKIEIRTDRIKDVVAEFDEMKKQGIDLTPISI